MIPVGLKSIDLKSTGIILFDRRPNRIWRDKIWHRTETYNGQKIEIWGMQKLKIDSSSVRHYFRMIGYQLVIMTFIDEEENKRVYPM